jgi:hypothetical protein
VHIRRLPNGPPRASRLDHHSGHSREALSQVFR